MNLNAIFNLVQAILLTVILAMSLITAHNYNKRIDSMSCRLDVATARIDLLNNKRVEIPSCVH